MLILDHRKKNIDIVGDGEIVVSLLDYNLFLVGLVMVMGDIKIPGED